MRQSSRPVRDGVLVVLPREEPRVLASVREGVLFVARDGEGDFFDQVRLSDLAP